ncbi:hypothetical protein BJX70DRAFT_407483 [Aspergillus crustosus]
MKFPLALLPLLFLRPISAAPSVCKCTPDHQRWKKLDWGRLNSTVSGKLIHNLPPAVSCYPGPAYDNEECAYVNSQWSNTSFQSEEPIGELPGKCKLGSSPIYSINATEPGDLAAGIAFAQKNNVRLVVRNTGHDLLGKSSGYGSLQIWLKYLQKGIQYQSKYQPSDSCSSGDWRGAAFSVTGGYVWDDVYEEAFARDLIVVGEGDPTVGVIGGYIQGGGHPPANRDFGLASDQILEAQVILADGLIVTANPRSHPDLFTAIRGGRGGTYGVVISVTTKAFPSTPVVAHTLVVFPQSTLNFDPITKYGNSSAGYQHAFAALNISLAEAQAALDPVRSKLASHPSITASVQWFEFPFYSAYYRALSGVHQSTGTPESALASRMFDKDALTSDRKALRDMIDIIAGTRGWLESMGPVIAQAIQDDITYNKYQAMRDLTPSGGSYVNEADRNSPWWKEDFYGLANYDRLVGIKGKYDPEGVFYCPTCVGSPS